MKKYLICLVALQIICLCSHAQGRISIKLDQHEIVPENHLYEIHGDYEIQIVLENLGQTDLSKVIDYAEFNFFGNAVREPRPGLQQQQQQDKYIGMHHQKVTPFVHEGNLYFPLCWLMFTSTIRSKSFFIPLMKIKQ